MNQPQPLKPLEWVASSRKDLKDFPKEVRYEAAFALLLAQKGDKSVNAVPMVGFGGAGVLEVIVSHEGEEYRSIYTVKFQKAVYVLHAFQKKSKKGSKTPQHDMDLIHTRLNAAKKHYLNTYDSKAKPKQENKHGRAS